MSGGNLVPVDIMLYSNSVDPRRRRVHQAWQRHHFGTTFSNNFSRLTGGKSLVRYNAEIDMAAEVEIPLVFQCWERCRKRAPILELARKERRDRVDFIAHARLHPQNRVPT